MQLTKTKNATRNIAFGMILKIYQMVLPFMMRTIIIYYLGVQYLGLNSLFSSILQVLNLAELGVGSAMVFSMYKPIAEDNEIKLCALMNLYKKYYRIIGAIILIGGIILIPFLPYLISGKLPEDVNLYALYLLNLAATVCTYWLFAYKNSLLQAYQRVDIVSKITIGTESLKYILQFVSLMIFRNYYLFCIVLVISQIITNIITALIVDKLYPNLKANGNLSDTELKDINQRIKDLFTAKLATTLLSSGDTLVISSFLGLTVLAVYQNYFYILSSILGCLTIIHGAITAGIGNSLLTEPLEKVKNDFDTIFMGILIIIGVCSCCFLILFQPFMELWVGSKYVVDYSIVILLVIYFWSYELTQFFSVYKEAAGIWHQDRFRPLICSAVNIFLNVILVNIIGLQGVITATIISSGFISLPWVTHNVFHYVFKDSWIHQLKKFIPVVIVNVLLCLIFIFLEFKIINHGIISIFLRGLISIIIPLVVYWLCFRKKTEFKNCILLAKKMIKHK